MANVFDELEDTQASSAFDELDWDTEKPANAFDELDWKEPKPDLSRTIQPFGVLPNAPVDLRTSEQQTREWADTEWGKQHPFTTPEEVSRLGEEAAAPSFALKLPTAPDIKDEPRSLLEHFETGPTQVLFGEKAADVQAQITRSAYNAAKSLPEFFASEDGVLTLLAGATGALGKAAVAGYFTYDTAKNLLNEAKRIGGEWDQMDALDKAKSLTGAAANLGLTVMLGKHLVEKGLSAIPKKESTALPGEPVAPELPIPPTVTDKPAVEPVVSEAIAPVPALESLLDSGKADNTVRKRLVTQTGLSVSEIADLEKLVSLREKYQKAYQNKETPTAERFSAPFNGQSAREALEVATDSGSQIEAEIKPGLPKLGDRPLDWKKNPEVAKWFQDNAERLEKLGFQVPDELKAAKPAAPTPAPTAAPVAPTPPVPVEMAAGPVRTEQQTLLDVPTSPKARSQQIDTLRRYDAALERQESKAPDTTTIDQYNNWRDRRTAIQTKLKELESAAMKDAKPTVPEPTPAAPAAEAKPAVSDWTSATEDILPPRPPESPPTASLVNPPTGPTELHAGIPVPKFANRKMSPLDQVTTSHSAKLQKSFDEARSAQKEISKAVPSERRQAAISIWREANGDLPTLQNWASNAKGKMLKRAATDAQSLTPAEIAIAGKADAAFKVLEARGNTFDVLRSHRDNYVPHVWDVAKPGTGWGGSMLKQRFRFSKARTFNTFFDGDQAGFKPKTLAIGKLLPAYIHEMNRVISDRQAVRDIAASVNKDGSPMAVPRGTSSVAEGEKGKAVLVQPKALRGEVDTMDYKVMSDQPALSNWTWAGKDTDGKPVFIKGELALHPDVYRRLNAMMGQSAIRQWYHDPVIGMGQIPRAVVRGLDTAQAAMKREMFGLLAPFHQVQEGTHGIGHMVNPFFNIPKIDLRNPAQFDAANHGLMLLPDRASSRVYLEGVGTKSSLLSQGLRKLGRTGQAISDVIDGYQDYLFHHYIPGIKFKTYEAMLGRNSKLYAKELASGEMTLSDVKITSAEQANAAYGHLNYALLDRNPTIQHFIQMAALAPDFLEARTRFAGQAAKGLSSKVGHEQFKAIAILAAVQAASAYIISNVTGGEYDSTHPFEVIHNGRRYFLRSVPEDIYAFLKDRRQFIYGRVNPLLVKGGIQLGTGLNYRGEKVDTLDTITELLAGYIPITARQLPGLRSLTETSRQSPTSPLQQLAGSLGLRISRYSPVSETYRAAGDWMDSKKIERNKGSYPISKYQQLRYALEDGDMDRARDQYDLLRQTMTMDKIDQGFKSSINHPFTGKKSTDEAFAASLTGHQRQLYLQALRTRQNMLNAFARLPAYRKK
jgi:hypothetical protein